MADTSNPARFMLNGGNPVLDLVNTLDNRYRADGPVELLCDYQDLLRFARQAGLLNVRQAGLLGAAANKDAAGRAAAAEALKSARTLREAAASVLYAVVDGRPPPAAAIHTLDGRYLDAVRHRQLKWHPSSTPSVAPTSACWVWRPCKQELALPNWMLAQAACDLMTSGMLDRLRACGSETCRWLFLDTSKNHTRRWCDMKICGNRMKARRFHARRQRDEG